MRKISPPPRFDPPTVQPLASCYTDFYSGLFPRLLIAVLSSMISKVQDPERRVVHGKWGRKRRGGDGEEEKGGGGSRFIYLFIYLVFLLI